MSQSFKLVSAFAGLLIAGTAHSPLAAQIGDVPSTSNQPRPQGFTEIFSSNPLESEWAIHGDNSLFAWDETRQALRVTWDSSRTNSYFHHPLGTTLSASDDFALSFDLVLQDIQGGSNPSKPSAFQIAIGFMNAAEARRASFSRGAGLESITGARSVVEWNYFPDTGFGTTVSPGVFSSNNLAQFSFAFPFDLAPQVQHRVTMRYTSTNRTLRTKMFLDGTPAKAIPDVVLPEQASFDFRLDSWAIASYSDAGQSGEFDGSVLAHGWVDNVVLELPAPLQLEPSVTANGQPGVHFWARQPWRYILERSEDLKRWLPVVEWVADRTGQATLSDPVPQAGKAFYRVLANLP